MKIKEIYLTDLHFGFKHSSTIWLNNQLDFFYKQLIPELNLINEKESPDQINIYILGDLFDNRKTMDINIGICVKNLLLNIINSVSNSNIWIISGNHDYYDNNEENEFINIFNLLYMDKLSPKIHISTNNVIIFNNNIFLPWYKTLTKEKLLDIFKNYKVENSNLLCHLILPNCGDSFIDAEIISFLIKNNINLISGHIHIPLLQPKINCYNLGSVFPLTFIDSNELRGYYLNEDINNFNPIFIENKISKKFWRFYDKSFLNIDKEILKNDYIELYLSTNNFDDVSFVETLKDLCLENNNIIVYNIPDELIIDTKNSQNIQFNMSELLDRMIPEYLNDKYKQIKNKQSECI